LISDPDTTSGGSDRQNQHAGGIAISSLRNGIRRACERYSKIDPRPS